MCDDCELNEGAVLQTAAEALASYLYNQTAISKVTSRKCLFLSPPEGADKKSLEEILASVDTEQVQPALSNITMIKGKKDKYYYDKRIMTKHYAELDALIEDKDILETIASVTRSDSKLYPRPTQFSKLMRVPFRFTQDEILGAVARMKNDEQYKDIDVVTASNGKSALFSDKYLSRRYAQALIQQIEVDDPENP